MSTKISILYGKNKVLGNLHLWRECFTNEYFLKIGKRKYDVSKQNVYLLCWYIYNNELEICNKNEINKLKTLYNKDTNKEK